jgi:hypothetical protein
MARKDDIFLSFIEHPIIKDKYRVDNSDLPTNLIEGRSSRHVIIKTIALIVDSQEQSPAESDVALQKKVLQFLNQEIL